MASNKPIFPVASRRLRTMAAPARVILAMLAVLIALAVMGGVVTAPTAAHAANTGSSLGSGPSSSAPKTEDSEPKDSGMSSEPGLGEQEPTPSKSESVDTDPGSDGTEPTQMPRVDAQAVIACAPGNVYSVNRGGELSHIASNGNVTRVGGPSSGTTFTQLNGVGISSGGTGIYAFDRTSNTVAAFQKFDLTNDVWRPFGQSFNAASSPGNFAGSLVAGAVDLKTGNYFFGGYEQNAQVFKLWRLNTTNGAVTYLGAVSTPGAGTGANGDIAFDSSGNLYILRNENRNATTVETKIFSVKDDALAAANGTSLAASASASLSTVAGVNGVAFDANGKAYVGAGNNVTTYDTPAWTAAGTLTTQLPGTTDLASCSSPASITLEKDVKNRVNSGDQFNLRLDQGTTNLGTATTTGSARGVQSERVGPLPAARNSTIRFSETGSGSADLSRYSSTYQCFSDGREISGASGTGTSGTITIPATGNEIVCRISNTPLTANVTINKKTQNASGGNEQNAQGWTVGSRAIATTGSVTQAPTGTTQTTDASGNARWTLTFGSAASRANIAISETQQGNYRFVSGTCRITRLDGSTQTTTLTNENAQNLGSIVQPGDDVQCNYVNRIKDATVKVDKSWNINGQTYANGSQPEGISAKLLLDPAGQPASDPAFGQTRTGFGFGDSVKIGETTTIDAARFPGCALKSKTISGTGITGTVPLTDNFSTTLAAAANSYTVTNTVECQTLTIVKDVKNDNGGTLTSADWNQNLFASPGSGSRLTYNSGERKFVPTGSYTISETTLAGYDQESIRCTGGTYNDATKTVAIAAGQNATCTVTNNDSGGTVAWEKVNGSGDFLDGSEWTLRGPGGSEVAIQDCVANSVDQCTGRDRNPAAGKFRIEELAWGDYTLVETRSPAGYVLDETEQTFSITRERLDHQFGEPFVNEQAESPTLPLTGGTGTLGYIIGGAVLVLSCAAGAYWLQRRRSQGRS
ncbi:hypothetical protein GCM10009700_15800 [Brevibacterium sanguinis]|uniref:LPXTG cell wall anchor domain-containing protein n=3 Tax=Brevibacteriaceae TaxID=85019 RepID=A0A7T4A1D4_9MICO|nr:LPXTG cell wall anchor domain-containing protein [Brevibacterium casei]